MSAPGIKKGHTHYQNNRGVADPWLPALPTVPLKALVCPGYEILFVYFIARACSMIRGINDAPLIRSIPHNTIHNTITPDPDLTMPPNPSLSGSENSEHIYYARFGLHTTPENDARGGRRYRELPMQDGPREIAGGRQSIQRVRSESRRSVRRTKLPRASHGRPLPMANMSNEKELRVTGNLHFEILKLALKGFPVPRFGCHCA